MSVLDASVVLKWLVDEADSERALRLREEYSYGKEEIVVPDLVLYEIANSLRHHPGFSTDEIKTAVRRFLHQGVLRTCATLLFYLFLSRPVVIGMRRFNKFIPLCQPAL